MKLLSPKEHDHCAMATQTGSKHNYNLFLLRRELGLFVCLFVCIDSAYKGEECSHRRTLTTEAKDKTASANE